MSLNKIRLSNLAARLYVPITLLGFTILAYAPLISSLGFYWDDWPLIWFGHLLGTHGYLEVLAGDRPFLAGVYLLSTSILGESPLQWQIFGIITRWGVSLACWWALSKLWKGFPTQVFWIAALFAVYPGFKQQPISVIYSNGYLLLIAFFLSFGFTVRALQDKHRFWLYTSLAVISDLVCSLSTEYYFGLNLVRLLIIYYLVKPHSNSFWNRIKRTVINWLPYIASLSAFLIWRVLVFGFPTYGPETLTNLTANNTTAIGSLLFRVFSDPFSTGLISWFKTFQFPALEDFQVLSQALFWIIFLAAIIFSLITLLFFRRISGGISNENGSISSEASLAGEMNFQKQAPCIAIAALVLPGIPYWITNLPIELQFPWDRFTLAFMFGSAILIVWLVDWVIKKPAQKQVILALFLAFAIASHVENANTYRREWQTQKDFFWQLTWRAPQLQDGTTILTYGLPMNYYSDNSLTAPLNWIYQPDNNTTRMPYFLAFTDVRVGASIPELKKDLPIYQKYRNAYFEGNTSDMVVVYYSPPSCLRILDPTQKKTSPYLPNELSKALSLSDISRIILDASPAVPPEHIFGKQPAPGWCYYFQKADLARQSGDWDTIVLMGDQARAANLEPADPTEYLVFIEGYANAGNWEMVNKLAEQAMKLNRNVNPQLCNLAARLGKTLAASENNLAGVEYLLSTYQCADQ